MNLHRVILNDFLSHKDTTIDFHSTRKVLIDGRSGSGKTAITEGIAWCLFGKGRLDNRSLVRNGQDSGYVEVTLVNGVNVWTIRRSITAKGSQTITISHEEDGALQPLSATSLKEKQTFIEKELLHCSYELFINSVIYPQDSGQNFVKQTAAKRKELLLEIVGAVDFEDYLARGKNKSAVIEKDVAEATTKIEMHTSHVQAAKVRLEELGKQSGGSLEELQKGLSEKEDLYKIAGDKRAKLSTEVVDLNGRVNAENEARTAVGILLPTLMKDEDPAEAKKQLAEIDKELEGLPGMIEKRDEESDKEEQAKWKKMAKDVKTADIDKATKKVDSIKETLQKLEVRKNNIKVSDNDICPATSKVCPKVAKVYKDLEAEVESDIADNRSTLMVTEIEIEESKEELKGIVIPEFDEDFIRMMETKIEKTAEKKLKKIVLTTEIENAEKAKEHNKEVLIQVAQAKSVLEEDHREEQTRAKAELETVEALWLTLNTEVSTLKEKIAVAETLEAEKKTVETTIADTTQLIDILTQKVEGLTKDEKCVKLIRDAFGANGIKVVVIDTILPKLERRINEILSELSDFKIKLDTQKDNASSDGKKEGLFITIINDQGEEMDFDGYSGGEKLKIVVSISEALAELQKLEFRIIDELFIGLDEESVGQFGEVLMRLQERFSQVMCISHIPQIKELFEDTIEVKKIESVSTIC